MEKEKIQAWDWARILIGEVPPAFLLEIVLRIAFVYMVLMVSMRMLGKRMSAQLTRNELAALVSLAAAIGVPILSPDRGLLPAAIISAVVVIASRGIARLSSQSERMEMITQGRIDLLVKDGVMMINGMTKSRITRERILSELRSHQLIHLGEVERLFLEANGSFSLIRSTHPQPGLCVIPEADQTFANEQQKTKSVVCHACGFTNTNNAQDCKNCGEQHWIQAVLKMPVQPK